MTDPRRSVDADRQALVARIDDLERRLEELPATLMRAWARDLQRMHEQLSTVVRASAAQASARQAGAGQATAPDGEHPALTEAFYQSLEDRFRGSEDEIRERQRAYVADLVATPGPGPVLDLGCGRGEFLSVLRDAELPAEGVDTNALACGHCRELGFRVEHGDLLDALERRPDASVRAVTMLQVAEHLEVAVLLEVLREARRVLHPGGLLLVETPNGANLSVAASTFWLDPTHQRPLHPQLLDFLARQAGFTRTELRGSSPMPVEAPAAGGPTDGPLTEHARRVHDLLFGDQDMALLAHVEA